MHTCTPPALEIKIAYDAAKHDCRQLLLRLLRYLRQTPPAHVDWLEVEELEEARTQLTDCLAALCLLTEEEREKYDPST
jgi:hypothetical protein